MSQIGREFILKVLSEQRRDICGNCQCGIDFSNPDAFCPNKKWGKAKIEGSRVTFKSTLPDSSKISPPNLSTMAKSFASAMIQEAQQSLMGFPKTTKEQRQQRMDICKSCEFFEKNRCKKCGCFMTVKTWMRSQSCPIGKW